VKAEKVPYLLFMETLSPNSAILDKTRELCSLILQSGEYQENLAKIETFFNDKEAQKAYRNFSKLGETLHQKQHAGELTDEDIAGYDAELAALKGNSITSEFMAAEETFNGIVQQVSRMVGKALELGRLPEPEDLAGGGCCSSGGCGCE
jgi:cell fate (sporulation/competence/biofilm development) regulator YlbF (YheA/YmcA/DUF963 family)